VGGGVKKHLQYKEKIKKILDILAAQRYIQCMNWIAIINGIILVVGIPTLCGLLVKVGKILKTLEIIETDLKENILPDLKDIRECLLRIEK